MYGAYDTEWAVFEHCPKTQKIMKFKTKEEAQAYCNEQNEAMDEYEAMYVPFVVRKIKGEE